MPRPRRTKNECRASWRCEMRAWLCFLCLLCILFLYLCLLLLHLSLPLLEHYERTGYIVLVAFSYLLLCVVRVLFVNIFSGAGSLRSRHYPTLFDLWRDFDHRLGHHGDWVFQRAHCRAHDQHFGDFSHRPRIVEPEAHVPRIRDLSHRGKLETRRKIKK